MPQRWSPTDVLQLCNDGRCVSHASSKNRKCQRPIAYNNFKRVNSLAAEIAAQEPDVELLRPTLRRMAEHGLCLRSHKNRVDEMVAEWERKIRAEYSQRNVLDRSRGIIPSNVSSRASSVQPGSMSSVATSVPDQSEIQILQETIAAMQEQIRVAQARLERLQYTPRSASSLSRVSTNDIPNLQLSRTSTSQSVSMSRSASARSAAPVPPVGNTPAQPPATASASVLSRCTRAHVRRMPLDETCAICYDGGLMSESVSSTLVWCKSGCGRSVHRDCFDAWEASCTEGERATTCVYCRTRWEYTCTC
ncbi:hypothetical protein EK21DRAFT_67485 [Setomelanomma holmii]|uniref:RING-type domain-containing protein n=1 Tax=Setomelanomma holmii TaxID=210430 RepID=A0A9P4H853_9PLEO|nr:hypothetical protein EK21DRAFT_67485 [Setomelanomma holmii]